MLAAELDGAETDEPVRVDGGGADELDASDVDEADEVDGDDEDGDDDDGDEDDKVMLRLDELRRQVSRGRPSCSADSSANSTTSCSSLFSFSLPRLLVLVLAGGIASTCASQALDDCRRTWRRPQEELGQVTLTRLDDNFFGCSA